ncbi:hypothetical protein LTR86_006693 [Recurvomyces mirabilis]|nr:hypothetical protein LTR86_006693 [Recurvomyces mirabilis]
MRNSAVIGAVNGRFSEVFGKLAAHQAKQNFAFAIIAGNLCANSETATEQEAGELDELLEVVKALEENAGQLCENLSVLGRTVSIKTSERFRVVAVGGAHAESNETGEYAATYTDDDAEALSKTAADVDILITSEWPAHIRDGSRVKGEGPLTAASESISGLCTAAKPKYHFSASSTFYEREPFFHDGPSPRSVTRFISIAPFGNAGKQKWIYAFSLEPSAQPPERLPDGCTASPFTGTRKRKLESQQADYNSFRYANGNGNGDSYARENYSHKRRRQPPPTPDKCYFCLSNPACETHMIGSIGENVYLTTAKGPLTTKQTYSEIDFPGHMLLIPLEHAPTMGAIADKETQQATVTEMQRYRSSLQNLLAERSKGEDGRAKLGAVCWEISRNTGIHLHWQFLPVPVDMIQRGLVEAAFDVEAENNDYPKFVKNISEMEEIEEGNFFKVMIWSESLRKDMVMSLDGDFRFDLQFGRKAMAKLLRLEGRTDWKSCSQSKVEESAEANLFKEAFKAHDFNLE